MRCYTRLSLAMLTLAIAALLSSQDASSQQARRRELAFTSSHSEVGGLVTPEEAANRLNLDGSSPEELLTGQSADLQAGQSWETDPASGETYLRDEFVVRIRDGFEPSAPSRLARTGVLDQEGALADGWRAVRLGRGVPLEAAMSEALSSGVVEEVSRIYRRTTQQIRPNDSFFDRQWNFGLIDMGSAWEINPGATQNIVVAVLDTGLNVVSGTYTFFGTVVGQVPIRFSAVPDLVTASNIVSPYDFVYGDTFPFDLNGHGTHVAGTIAQTTNNSDGAAGVAYNVKLMPLKVLSDSSSTYGWDDWLAPGHRAGSDTMISQAIRYAADRGAHVINMSLGGPGGPSPILRSAIEYAVGRGSFVVMAAGNAAETGNPVIYPAAFAREIRGAMAVGAVNRNLRRAAYSSFQPYVEICAPGGIALGTETAYDVDVTQVSYPEFATLTYLDSFQKLLALRRGFRPAFDQFRMIAMGGTSMAAPHVAGVAALLRSQGITSPGAIEDAIKQFARPINATANECGAGLVDPRRALRGLGLAR
jgi:subtilisin family serine protease